MLNHFDISAFPTSSLHQLNQPWKLGRCHFLLLLLPIPFIKRQGGLTGHVAQLGYVCSPEEDKQLPLSKAWTWLLELQVSRWYLEMNECCRIHSVIVFKLLLLLRMNKEKCTIFLHNCLTKVNLLKAYNIFTVINAHIRSFGLRLFPSYWSTTVSVFLQGAIAYHVQIHQQMLKSKVAKWFSLHLWSQSLQYPGGGWKSPRITAGLQVTVISFP